MLYRRKLLTNENILKPGGKISKRKDTKSFSEESFIVCMKDTLEVKNLASIVF